MLNTFIENRLFEAMSSGLLRAPLNQGNGCDSCAKGDSPESRIVRLATVPE